jgi:hypothetical protein
LAAQKASIVEDQKATLEPLRDEACKELRASRDAQYRELLDNQREFRDYLRGCQDVGLDSMPLLLSLTERDATQNIAEVFREAAEETTQPAGDPRGEFNRPADEDREGSGGADGTIVDVGVAALTAFDSLLSIFEGTKPAPRRQAVETGSFESAAAEVQKRAREEEEAKDREKHRALYRE